MRLFAYRPRTFALEMLMFALLIGFAFPVYVLVTIAFKTPPEVAASPVALPSTLNWDNFVQAWADGNLARAMGNSLLITSVSILLLVAVGALASYAIARSGRRFSAAAFVLFLLGMMIPLQLGMVPLYTLMRDLGLLGSHTSLIAFHTGSQLPLTIFLYSGFLRTLSPTYEEAARVDGASSWQVFSRIALPLLRPITGTVVIINAIAIWNDFLTPLLYVGNSPNRTLPVAIYSFRGEYATNWGMTFAGIVVAILPVLIIYFLLQKYIIRGFASGMKG